MKGYLKKLVFLVIAICCFNATSQVALSDTVCLNVVVDITNTSAGIDSLSWDFCHEDLNSAGGFASTINIPSIRTYLTSTVRDGDEWYQFVSARNSSVIYRISYGNSLSNSPTVIDFLDDVTPGNLSLPRKMVFWYESGNWYALVTNLTTHSLTRLDFGASLANMPTATDLGNLSSWNQLHGIDLVDDDGDIIVMVTSLEGDELTLLNFGNSILNIPSGGDILDIGSGETLIDGPMGVRLIETPQGWFGFVACNVSGEVVRMEFGANLMSTPVFSSEYSLSGATDVEVAREGLSYHIFGANEAGTLANIEYLSDFGTTPSIDVTSTSTNRNFNFELVREEPSWVAFASNWASRIVLKHSFTNTCNPSTSNIEISTDSEPLLSYASTGTYITKLTNYTNGFTETYLDTLFVRDEIPPSISFTVDEYRCVTVQNNFTSIGSMDISDYSWDFGDGSPVNTDPSPSHTYASSGTYTIRLDVNNANCNNFHEQEITIYDPPPAPSYTYSSVRTCINADFTFTNITADGAYAGPLQYLWEFIDEPSGTIVATATTKDAVYAFETAGEKTVRLTSSIPGCTEVTEQTLMITPGPTADFFAASVCQNEAMDFTNTSTDAISFSWDFGDGFMSTATNPSHVFTGAGNFFVTLTAFDAEGCEDTEVIEVAISDSPQISFDFDIPCTSSDGIQFFDLTTVDNADLVTWTWFVDDVEVSNQQSPQITFGSTGVKNIRLDVQSSNGCESSYNEDIEVLASPAPDFTIDLGCQGETSSFIDNTAATGNPIVSWLWTVDGTNYGTQDISHVFTDAGTYDVTLEVTGQNFCSESITKSVEIIELPTVSFAIQGECDNQLIRASDQSTVSADPVISRRWMLDGENVGNGTGLILSELADDTYVLSLELETQEGCIISASQALIINEAPQSSFTSSRTYGVPNDQLTFTNTSIGGVSYQWLLDGLPRSTNPQSELITFAESGTYNVSLVTQNSLGCNDTTNQEILIAVPEVDLAIGSFELVSENNVGKIFLEVQNFSNLPVEIIDAQIVLENTFTISEQIISFIDVGESRLVNLNVGIPLNISEPSYFCVKLSSQYAEYQDLEPVNNEKCITIEPVIKVEDPFPNPVTDQFRLKLIVNESGAANISLINSAGKIQINNVEPVSKGLNNFFIDMSLLDPGIYYVTVDVLGTTHKRKVIKL